MNITDKKNVPHEKTYRHQFWNSCVWSEKSFSWFLRPISLVRPFRCFSYTPLENLWERVYKIINIVPQFAHQNGKKNLKLKYVLIHFCSLTLSTSLVALREFCNCFYYFLKMNFSAHIIAGNVLWEYSFIKVKAVWKTSSRRARLNFNSTW